ncbi:MAG: tetratricopeptide repeat protein [Deinococcota bacterium]
MNAQQPRAVGTSTNPSQAAESKPLDLVEHYLNISKPQLAQRALKRASLDAEPYRFLYLSGRVQYQLGKYTQAEEAALAALEHHPDDLQAGYLLVQCLRQLKRYDDALTRLDRLREQYPARADLAELVGFVRLSQSNYSAMNQALAEAKKLRADAPNNMLEASVALMYGKFNVALDHALNALRNNPDDPHVHHLLAQAHQKLWHLDEALSHAQVAVSLRPESRVYRMNVRELEVMTHPLYQPFAKLMAWNFHRKAWPLVISLFGGIALTLIGLFVEQLWLVMLGFAVAVAPSAGLGIGVLLVSLSLTVYFYWQRRT